MIRSLLILLCILLLTGCVQKKILDDIQMVTIIGYDVPDEDKDGGLIKGIAVAPQYQPDGKVDNTVFIESAELSKEIRSQYNSGSSKPIVSGKLEVALFSREIAEKDGVIELVDTLQRDPSIGSRVFLGVANGEIEEMLSTNYGNVDTGTYFNDILTHNSKHGMLPQTNLHSFLYSYFSEGSDPFLPLLEMDDETVKIIGIALLNGDKMVGELDADSLFTFKILYEKFSSNDSFSVKLGPDKYASIYNIASKRKIDYKRAGNGKILITGNILGVIKEYSGNKLSPEALKEIKETMEKDIEERGTKMIKTFQELRIDPLSLGNVVRSRTRGEFDRDKWIDEYKDMDISFDMNVKITESGIIE
ncbi:Ger(x)C family spore germination protein [Pseudalkalibacillus hwajinpoensis]|uniref:Ger(X)C family spore germination protein n=1 Tax=Guptibacillus hwajinpoensis TaxID=208199 RepID=A0A4U1MEX2_9BACL|nr:Ger(x)C family spore germination protein [Pseudalkalibacillus hwajinpoensis]TKD68804.1 Ger(x)C family spore germination protein [Pseudalkalibacillus hwajinpoensis]